MDDTTAYAVMTLRQEANFRGTHQLGASFATSASGVLRKPQSCFRFGCELRSAQINVFIFVV